MDGCVDIELECLKLDDVTADKSVDIDVVVVLYTDEPADVIPMEVVVVVKHVFKISNEIPGGPHSTSITSLDFPEINKLYNFVFYLLSLYICSTTFKTQIMKPGKIHRFHILTIRTAITFIEIR